MTTSPVTEATHERRDGFLPIADYAMLSDSSSAALVSKDGSIDWLCLPRFDSSALFSRLLDPEAGHWQIVPREPFTVERRYLPGTLVLETTFTTGSGKAKLVDALAFAEGQRQHELGMNPPHELLRYVEGIEGSVEFDMELAPRPEYGLVHPLVRMTEDGARTFGGPNPVAVRSDASIAVEASTMYSRFTVAAGERLGFALRWAPPESVIPTPTAPADVPARVEDTAAGWRSWEDEHDIYEGPHRDLVKFSARVLKGLTYRPTGAIVAAATTSLPEDVGGERNWDYRYAWIRDASLPLQALYIGSCSDEAENFV